IIIPATGGGDPAGTPSNPYPTKSNVSGLNGTITKVTAQLFDYNQLRPGDGHVLLDGLRGQEILLMSDVGGYGSAKQVNLTFDDAGASMAPNITSGTFRPTNNGADDLFPSPAPPGPYPDPQRLSTFLNLNPNGVWSLYAVDDLLGLGGGNING